MSEAVATETLVVGAGPAGLATAACLRKAGLPFEIVDRADSLASSWRGHYDRLHLHTPKSTSALPYRRFPRGTPRYPSRDEVVRYLESYAQELGIAPRLGHEVRRIERNERGAWRAETSKAVFEAKRVVIATGYNRVPNEPAIRGRERFAGRILHSSRYRSGEEMRGKRVLVVGFGNSGAEIALDLHEHGAEVSVSLRGGANVVPRDFLFVAMQHYTILLEPLPLAVKDLIGRTVATIAYGDMRRHGLAPRPIGILTQVATQNRVPVLDVGAVRLIKEGKIAVLPGIHELLADGAIFADGRQKSFDAIVLATGFRTGLGGLVDRELLDENELPETDPAKTGEKGIYFVGYTVPATGVLRRISREARRVVRDIERRRNGV